MIRGWKYPPQNLGRGEGTLLKERIGSPEAAVAPTMKTQNQTQRITVGSSKPAYGTQKGVSPRKVMESFTRQRKRVERERLAEADTKYKNAETSCKNAYIFYMSCSLVWWKVQSTCYNRTLSTYFFRLEHVWHSLAKKTPQSTALFVVLVHSPRHPHVLQAVLVICDHLCVSCSSTQTQQHTWSQHQTVYHCPTWLSETHTHTHTLTHADTHTHT